jgi:hypothetical protein
MKRTVLETDLILLNLYPNAFTHRPELANLTLSELVKKWDEEVLAGKYRKIVEQIFSFLYYPELVHDVLIEAAKSNHYNLVELMVGLEGIEAVADIDPSCIEEPDAIMLKHKYGKVVVIDDIIKKHIDSINTKSNNQVSNLLCDELFLCAQNTPTEVLFLINGGINHITHYRYNNKCTDSMLDNYLYFNICDNLNEASNFEQRSEGYNTNHPMFKEPNEYTKDAIKNIKFLCGVINDSFPNKVEFIERLAKTICEYKKLFTPQLTQELPAFLISAIMLHENNAESELKPVA